MNLVDKSLFLCYDTNIKLINKKECDSNCLVKKKRKNMYQKPSVKIEKW